MFLVPIIEAWERSRFWVLGGPQDPQEPHGEPMRPMGSLWVPQGAQWAIAPWGPRGYTGKLPINCLNGGVLVCLGGN